MRRYSELMCQGIPSVHCSAGNKIIAVILVQTGFWFFQWIPLVHYSRFYDPRSTGHHFQLPESYLFVHPGFSLSATIL